MGRGVATFGLLAGAFVCAVGLGILPPQYFPIHAPRSAVVGVGALIAILAFMALARDHRVSQTISSLLLLAIAVGAGWLTFVAPPGTVNRYVPFVPQSVNEALARLLFGLGVATCVGMGFLGLRRILR